MSFKEPVEKHANSIPEIAVGPEFERGTGPSALLGVGRLNARFILFSKVSKANQTAKKNFSKINKDDW